jgi:regulatory protein
MSGEYVIKEVRRREGKLREIITSGGRKFLILKDSVSPGFLKVGRKLDKGDVEQLAGPLARQAGLSRAVKFLEYRERTEWEIKRRLSRDGIEDETILDDIIATLKKQGYVDDRRMAKNYIGYLIEKKFSGPSLIRKKLRTIGIDDEIIGALIMENLPEDREREIAVRLATVKLDKKLERGRAVQRMERLLKRHGFSGSVINDICMKILRGEALPKLS